MRELHSVSPLATLARGYSITMDENEQVITDVNQLTPGDELVTKLHQGQVISTIKAVSN